MEQAVTVLGSQPRIRFGLTGWLRLLGLSEATHDENETVRRILGLGDDRYK